MPVSPSRRDALGVLPYRALLRADDWEARKRMVMDLYGSGRPEAAAVLRQALQDPDERIRLYAAQALERLSERFEKAIQRERRRVDADPEDPDAHLELARLLYERAMRSGQAAEAERSSFSESAWHLGAAMDRLAEPRLTSARLQLGRVYSRLGRARDACAVLSLVPKTAPDYPNARFLIAEMRLAMGDVAACRAELEALAAGPLRNGMKSAVSFWTGKA